MAVGDRLEQLMQDFLWGGTGEERQDHLVSWDQVSWPRGEGGFGLGNVVLKDISLVWKWLWRFPLEPNSLWHRVVKSKYGLQQKGWDASVSAGVSGSSLP